MRQQREALVKGMEDPAFSLQLAARCCSCEPGLAEAGRPMTRELASFIFA